MASASTLDALPFDILDLVLREAKECAPKDFCDLRLVCKALNELVEPLAFSSISIRLVKDDSEKWKSIPEFLSSLASGTSPYVRWAKELRVIRLVPNQYPENYDRDWRSRHDPWRLADSDREMMLACQNKWIVPAIESLVRVERVHFLADSIQPYHDALRALTKLPRLRDLGVYFQGPISGYIPLSEFSNLSVVWFISLRMTPSIVEGLKRLLARSPSITTLSLFGKPEMDAVEFGSFLEDAKELQANDSAGDRKVFPASSNLQRLSVSATWFKLSSSCTPFLQTLTSLEIAEDSSHIHPSFWRSLQDLGVHLQELNVGPLQQPAVDYLLSYSGLRSFTLDSSRKDPEGVEDITHHFFVSILPMHRSTLSKLIIRNTKAGSWAITRAYLEGLSLCKNIESLQLVCHFPLEDTDESPMIPLADLFSGISDNLPRLQTFRLCHTRKLQEEIELRLSHTKTVSEKFVYRIAHSESRFSAKRQPRFILRAGGSGFVPVLDEGSDSGSGWYRFMRLDSDNPRLKIDGPLFMDDQGFY